MPIHREHRRADVRGVLDEFEGWLLRERSVQERTAGVYTARVAGLVAWLPTPTEESLRCLTAATVVEWVNLEAARGLKYSTLGKQLVMLRSFLQFCHRSGRTGKDLSGGGAARGGLAVVVGPGAGSGGHDRGAVRQSRFAFPEGAAEPGDLAAADRAGAAGV